MPDNLVTGTSFAAAFGAALVGGVFFGFSNFVMAGLGRMPSEQVVAAMNSINVTVINPGFHRPEMFTTGALADWDHSAWARRDVIHAGADKVHIDTRFNRYRKDGSVIGGFDSIYIVTRVDGRWGIQGRSSFAP